MKKYYLELQLFADGAGSGDGTGNAGSAGGTNAAENNASEVAAPGKGRKASLSNVVYGKQSEQPSDDYSKQTGVPGKEKAVSTKELEERSVQFENLIKGEYKDEFNSRVQKIVQNRIGDTKALQEQSQAVQPIIELLSSKYGVDAKDINALAKAIQDDNSLYQSEAAKRGLSVEQYKEVRKLEQDNQNLKTAMEEMNRQKRGEEIYGKWMEESQALQQKYGLQDFDFSAEAQNPDFINLLKSGVSVEGAYKAIHFDDMIGGAMAATARNVQQQTAKNIASRTARPTEGAVSSQPGVTVKTDVHSLTKADREEIARRVSLGEIIRF